MEQINNDAFFISEEYGLPEASRDKILAAFDTLYEHFVATKDKAEADAQSPLCLQTTFIATMTWLTLQYILSRGPLNSMQVNGGLQNGLDAFVAIINQAQHPTTGTLN